jgi:hypothetical protein
VIVGEVGVAGKISTPYVSLRGTNCIWWLCTHNSNRAGMMFRGNLLFGIVHVYLPVMKKYEHC